jgi:hypothetical protein
MPKSSPSSANGHANARPEAAVPPLPAPVFEDKKHDIKIFQGDCVEILRSIPADSVDLIFADPPYFLSNNGITCHAGRMVSVNKGEWDRSRGAEANHEFNRAWLAACQRVLKPDGSGRELAFGMWSHASCRRNAWWNLSHGPEQGTRTHTSQPSQAIQVRGAPPRS